jgi:hypothetical protein
MPIVLDVAHETSVAEGGTDLRRQAASERHDGVPGILRAHAGTNIAPTEQEA